MKSKTQNLGPKIQVQNQNLKTEIQIPKLEPTEPRDPKPDPQNSETRNKKSKTWTRNPNPELWFLKKAVLPTPLTGGTPRANPESLKSPKLLQQLLHSPP